MGASFTEATQSARIKLTYRTEHGFLPVSIAKEVRLDYFNALEAYAVHGD
ncbi:hypothetical protein NSS79_03605 [Paenibacillus sp. FSL L8-0436]